MDTIESKVVHFQKTVMETLYNSVNRSDWDELEIASKELSKLMYENTSDIAAFNLLSDVLKMFNIVRKECLARLGEAELLQKNGNEHLLEKNYQEATTYYTRSLIWNPRDSKVYSNRALCYMSLEKMPRALDDADKCIELDPQFSGGYFIKGSVQILMNDHKKAFDTFQEGLKHDPTDKRLLGGVERCIQKLHEASCGDSSRKDKAAEGTILSQQEKGESSSFENVTRQECADHNFTKDKAVKGTIVFQQEKGKCCSFNEHVIYNMPTVNPNMPTVNPNMPAVNPNMPAVNPNMPPVNPNMPPVNPNMPPVNPNMPPVNPNMPPVKPNLPTVKPTSPGHFVFGLKLSQLVLIAEVVSMFADFMELPALGMLCSVVAVLGNFVSAKRDHYKPFPMLKLLFAAVQLITCILMCLSELLDEEIQWLEVFGREARSYHLCMLLISLSLHH